MLLISAKRWGFGAAEPNHEPKSLQSVPPNLNPGAVAQMQPCHTSPPPWERTTPLTRDALVVFGATGTEASNNVMLAAGKKFVIKVLG